MKTLCTNLHIHNYPAADALIINENRIEAIGKRDELKDLVDQETDMKEAWVYPGFHDSHLHLLMLGQALECAPLQNASSISEIIELLQKQNSGVIHGMGWNQENLNEKRMPTCQDLDPYFQDVPVIVERSCTHILCANTAAMKLAGVYSEDGLFYEDDCLAFMPLLEQEEEAFIERAVEHCLDVGLTCVQPADLKSHNWKRRLPIYKKMAEKIRIHHQINITEPDIMDEFLEAAKKYETETHTFGPFKGFADGALGGRTAWMKQDYADDPGNRGIPLMDEKVMSEFVCACKERNRPVTFHAIGDAAMDQILRVYKKYQDENNSGRWGILHVQITDEDILNAFKDQKIAAMMQPVFWKEDSRVVESRCGKDLAATSYAFGRLNKTTHFSMGTDAPIEDCDPFDNIDWALRADDPLTLDEALKAYTEQSAWTAFKEHELGKIEPGYLADLVFLDREIKEFEHPVVLNVMVNGKFRIDPES